MCDLCISHRERIDVPGLLIWGLPMSYALANRMWTDVMYITSKQKLEAATRIWASLLPSVLCQEISYKGCSFSLGSGGESQAISTELTHSLQQKVSRKYKFVILRNHWNAEVITTTKLNTVKIGTRSRVLLSSPPPPKIIKVCDVGVEARWQTARKL